MPSDIKSRIGGRSFLAAAKLVQAGQTLLLIFSLRRKYSTDTNTNMAQIQIRNKYKYNVDTDTNMTQIQMRKRNLGDPEFLLVLHHVGQYGTSNEDLSKKMIMLIDYNLDGDDDEENLHRIMILMEIMMIHNVFSCGSLFRPCIVKIILIILMTATMATSPCLFFWVDPQF